VLVALQELLVRWEFRKPLILCTLTYEPMKSIYGYIVKRVIV
jgi:hypothetical protein